MTLSRYRERPLFIPGIFVHIIDNDNKNRFLEKYDILLLLGWRIFLINEFDKVSNNRVLYFQKFFFIRRSQYRLKG